MMKVVQMTVDEDLLAQVDELVSELGTSRSAFARQALKEAVRRLRCRRLEQEEREGYERLPVEPGEFDLDDGAVDWGNPWPET